jgi:chromosomal replication initiator protein
MVLMSDEDDVKVRNEKIAAIKCAVAFFFGMPIEGLHQKSTARSVTVPRQIAMYLVKQMTDASLSEIGHHFGDKHHKTVIAAIAKVDRQRRTKGDVDLVVRVLEQSVAAKPAPDCNL